MAGPIYNAVWLFLCTLHPAYASFKAVKSKNLKEYVRWMMYWIVFALFSAIESILDPLLTFWLPFYCEVKVVLLLYLVCPADLQIILSLLGTWFINQNPTDKSGKKIVIFSHNRSKNFQNPF